MFCHHGNCKFKTLTFLQIRCYILLSLLWQLLWTRALAVVKFNDGGYSRESMIARDRQTDIYTTVSYGPRQNRKITTTDWYCVEQIPDIRTMVVSQTYPRNRWSRHSRGTVSCNSSCWNCDFAEEIAACLYINAETIGLLISPTCLCRTASEWGRYYVEVLHPVSVASLGLSFVYMGLITWVSEYICLQVNTCRVCLYITPDYLRYYQLFLPV